jgi:DNA-binding response OmpR family regulator
MNKATLLLVEDDSNLGFVIKDHLDFRGYAVHWCKDGETAWNTFQSSSFDLCILDIMLPKMNGFELIKSIREHNEQVPVIFISARAFNEDKIEGLKLGADDYVIKPFSIEELVLRIEVFLKRSKKKTSSKNLFTINEYTFNYSDQTLTYYCETLTVTKKEAEVLKLLCTHLNETVKREDILKLIWGDDDYFMGRSLDVYISRIRKYLRHDRKVEINNIFAVGFKLTIKTE